MDLTDSTSSLTSEPSPSLSLVTRAASSEEMERWFYREAWLGSDCDQLVTPPLSARTESQSPPRYPALQRKLRALDLFAGAD